MSVSLSKQDDNFITFDEQTLANGIEDMIKRKIPEAKNNGMNSVLNR